MMYLYRSIRREIIDIVLTKVQKIFKIFKNKKR